jgi:hypothetical protein
MTEIAILQRPEPKKRQTHRRGASVKQSAKRLFMDVKSIKEIVEG